jgi:hypothetical protein
MALNRSDKSRILRRYSPGMTRNSEMSTEPSSFDECQQLMKDSQGGAVEDGDGEAMEQRRRGGGDGVFR